MLIVVEKSMEEIEVCKQLFGVGKLCHNLYIFHGSYCWTK